MNINILILLLLINIAKGYIDFPIHSNNIMQYEYNSRLNNNDIKIKLQKLFGKNHYICDQIISSCEFGKNHGIYMIKDKYDIIHDCCLLYDYAYKLDI